MAPQFLTLAEAAHMLGVTPEALSEMRKKSDIFGYRDGSDWKFKVDEVERVAQEKDIELNRDPYEAPAAEVPASETEGADDELSLDDPDDDGSSILVSEEELGHSGETTSSTIIGKKEGESSGPESDLKLADEGTTAKPASDVLNADDDLNLGSDLDLAGDSLTLGESDVDLESGSGSLGDSALDLSDDDDDLVLGGGSDVSVSGDSGINLMSPSQSGISLEDEGMELGGSAVEALELPEDDDVISLDEEPADPEAATQLKADDNFDLSPLDFAGDDEDSGSQVIALDDSADYDENAATTLGAPLEATEAPLGGPLDEDDFGPAPGAAAGAGTGPSPVPAGAYTPAHALPEAPYGIFSVLFLFVVVCVLMLTGIIMLDLLSNMFNWEGPHESINPITKQILQMIGLVN